MVTVAHSCVFTVHHGESDSQLDISYTGSLCITVTVARRCMLCSLCIMVTVLTAVYVVFTVYHGDSGSQLCVLCSLCIMVTVLTAVCVAFTVYHGDSAHSCVCCVHYVSW